MGFRPGDTSSHPRVAGSSSSSVDTTCGDGDQKARGALGNDFSTTVMTSPDGNDSSSEEKDTDIVNMKFGYTRAQERNVIKHLILRIWEHAFSRARDSEYEKYFHREDEPEEQYVDVVPAYPDDPLPLRPPTSSTNAAWGAEQIDKRIHFKHSRQPNKSQLLPQA